MTGRSPDLRASTPARRGRLTLGVVVVVVVLVGGGSLWSLPAHAAPTGGSPLAPDIRSASGGLILTLVPSPQTGPAPLVVNVTASVSGGAAPYALTVCFGTADHTSPDGDCSPSILDWSGGAAVVLSHVFPAPGNFSVLGLANDSRGQSVGSSSLVVVGPVAGAPVIVNAEEATTSGAAPLSVTFNESVAGQPAPLAVAWTFGDGGTALGAAGVLVTHVYSQLGTFTPVLTVTDGSGHRSSESLPAITVTPAHSSSPTIVPGLSASAGAELLTAFAIAAVLSAAVVYVVRQRRWRREGDEIVQWLRSGEPRTRAPPRSP